MERNLESYYYSFRPTGIDAIDAILEAVALAGTRFHNTSDWQDEYEGTTSQQIIQDAADDAVTSLINPIVRRSVMELID